MGSIGGRCAVASLEMRPAHERSATAPRCRGDRPVKPLAELPRAGIRALLFVIDDTLTTHGKLTADAYAALERLHAAGKRTVAVTGRPAGWCDHLARMWPVDAVVGENGAFYFRYANGRLHRRYRHRRAAAPRRSSSGPPRGRPGARDSG